MTGQMEYFVVNHQSRQGCWVSENSVQLSSLVTYQSDRAQAFRKKIFVCIEKKLLKEEEERRRDQEAKRKEEEDRRRVKAAAEAEGKANAKALALAKAQAQAKAKAEAKAKAKAKADENARRKEEVWRKMEEKKIVMAKAQALAKQVLEAEAKVNEFRKAKAQAKTEANSAKISAKADVWEAKATEEVWTASKIRLQDCRKGATKVGKHSFEARREAMFGASGIEMVVSRHRNEVIQLLKDAAANGLQSVDIELMNAPRSKHLSELKAANAFSRRLGGVLLKEKDLLQRLSEAEANALKDYIQILSAKQCQESSTPATNPPVEAIKHKTKYEQGERKWDIVDSFEGDSMQQQQQQDAMSDAFLTSLNETQKPAQSSIMLGNPHLPLRNVNNLNYNQCQYQQNLTDDFSDVPQVGAYQVFSDVSLQPRPIQGQHMHYGKTAKLPSLSLSSNSPSSLYFPAIGSNPSQSLYQQELNSNITGHHQDFIGVHGHLSSSSTNQQRILQDQTCSFVQGSGINLQHQMQNLLQNTPIEAASLVGITNSQTTPSDQNILQGQFKSNCESNFALQGNNRNIGMFNPPMSQDMHQPSTQQMYLGEIGSTQPQPHNICYQSTYPSSVALQNENGGPLLSQGVGLEQQPSRNTRVIGGNYMISGPIQQSNNLNEKAFSFSPLPRTYPPSQPNTVPYQRGQNFYR